MKTIAIFTGYYLPHVGGVERYTYNLAKRLKHMGYKTIIITARYNENLKEIEETEFAKIYRLPTLKIVSETYPIIIQNKRCKQLLEMVEAENIDSTIIQTRFWLTSYVGSKFVRKNNLPVCLIEHGTSHFTVHNKILDMFGHIYEHILTNTVKKNIKNFYGVSQKCTEWLKHFKIEANGVFYNSIDTEEMQKYEQYIKKNNEKTIITFAGRMLTEKGVLNLIEAFKNLNEKYPNIELHLAGDGELFERIKQENSENENIKILGRLEHEDTMKLLGKTNIFVNPSFSEGLPTTVLEAGVMECAVVATPVGGTTEIITNNEIGYTCGFKPKEIEEQVEKLILNKEQQIKLGKNIKQKVINEFSWNKTTEKIVNTIEFK